VALLLVGAIDYLFRDRKNSPRSAMFCLFSTNLDQWTVSMQMEAAIGNGMPQELSVVNKKVVSKGRCAHCGGFAGSFLSSSARFSVLRRGPRAL
jgi:hypothetical protein